MPAWIPLALVSALTAALVGVFGKLGVKDLDPTLATAARATVMAVFLVTLAAALGKLRGAGALVGRPLLWIALAGLAGAASWLAYFWALKTGPLGGVVVLDRLSIVLGVLAGVLLFQESFTVATVLGTLMVLGGALLIAWK